MATEVETPARRSDVVDVIGFPGTGFGGYNRAVRILIALLVLLMADTVLAQGAPKTVYFDGPVDKPNVDYTLRRLSPGDTLVINSRGGNGGEALRLAEFIRNNRVNTHVNTTGQAQSAAVIVYAAGHKRTAGKNAQFWLHMGKDKDGNESQELTKQYFQHLLRYGVNDKITQLPVIQETLTLSPDMGRYVGLVTD